MSRASELGTAAVIAASAIAALIWWPDADAPIAVTAEAESVPVANRSSASAMMTTIVTPDPAPEYDPALTSDLFEVPDVRDASGTDAEFEAPGALTDGSGTGVRTTVNFAPGMRFPVETAQAIANSQTWSTGGFFGPDGQQCAPENYAYPWRDTFCEDGGAGAPACPAGGGHMGQDLRPPTCQGNTYWAVAASDGVITSVGAFSVRLMSEDGVRFIYLHLDPASVTVETGDAVARGDRLGRISNAYGGTPANVHLHFEIRSVYLAGDAGLMTTPVPPYPALVDAYARLASGRERAEES